MDYLPTITMTSDELRDWQAQQGLIYTTAAEALGVSRGTYSNYLNGHARIPKMLGLACAAISAGIPAWTENNRKQQEII